MEGGKYVLLNSAGVMRSLLRVRTGSLGLKGFISKIINKEGDDKRANL